MRIGNNKTLSPRSHDKQAGIHIVYWNCKQVGGSVKETRDGKCAQAGVGSMRGAWIAAPPSSGGGRTAVRRVEACSTAPPCLMAHFTGQGTDSAKLCSRFTACWSLGTCCRPRLRGSPASPREVCEVVRRHVGVLVIFAPAAPSHATHIDRDGDRDRDRDRDKDRVGETERQGRRSRRRGEPSKP